MQYNVLKGSVKLPEVINEDELIKLLSLTKNVNHRIAFALGFYQAMRVSEVVKLRQENIDYNVKLIKIKDAKGSKDRNIPIAPQIIKGLKRIPINIGIRALQIAFKKGVKKHLGKNLHFHSLRHSGITHYGVVKKWNVLDLQRFAGHSSPATTQIYYHIRPQDMVDKMWEDKIIEKSEKKQYKTLRF